MKKLVLIVILLLGGILMWRTCSEERADDGCTAADLAEAVAAGERDATQAADAAPGSMERQNLILAIRARQQRIADAGFTVAADSYGVAAERTLHLRGVLE